MAVRTVFDLLNVLKLLLIIFFCVIQFFKLSPPISCKELPQLSHDANHEHVQLEWRHKYTEVSWVDTNLVETFRNSQSHRRSKMDVCHQRNTITAQIEKLVQDKRNFWLKKKNDCLLEDSRLTSS